MYIVFKTNLSVNAMNIYSLPLYALNKLYCPWHPLYLSVDGLSNPLKSKRSPFIECPDGSYWFTCEEEGPTYQNHIRWGLGVYTRITILLQRIKGMKLLEVLSQIKILMMGKINMIDSECYDCCARAWYRTEYSFDAIS